MTIPWIGTSPSDRANRWLDDTGVQLRGSTQGQATVGGTLGMDAGLASTVVGNATTSGALIRATVLEARSDGGAAIVGNLGRIWSLAGLATSGSSVVADLGVGIHYGLNGQASGSGSVLADLGWLIDLAGRADGRATLVAADLAIKPAPSYDISGLQVGERRGFWN